MRRLRKEELTGVLLVSIVFLVVLIFLLQIPKQVLLGPEITLRFPSSCSNSDISASWDTIFDESSSGITILTDGTITNHFCNKFAAYKIQDDNLTRLMKGQVSGNKITINSYYLNSSREFVQALITSNSVNSIISLDLTYKNSTKLLNEINLSQANLTFQSLFRFANLTWSTTSGEKAYRFQESSINNSFNLSTEGTIYSNYSFAQLNLELENMTITACQANWTIRSGSCDSGDNRAFWYIDSNDCRTLSGIPSNYTSPCDHDGNGIIGNLTELTSNFNIRIFINNALANITHRYNETKTVELKDINNTVRVEFSWNFSATPLNVRVIDVKKQSGSSSYGYLIVNGINVSKTIKVDIIGGGNTVCVEDSFISSISDITTNCNGNNEKRIVCPGSNGSIDCDVTSNKFEISDLMHSAAKEITSSDDDGDGDDDGDTCIVNWTCSGWSACVNSVQTRVCVDRNSCGVLTNKPNETQSCSSCVSNWTYSSWTPSKCPKNETQTRIGTDTSNCASTKTESRTCTYESSSTWLIVLIVIIVSLLIIGIVIAIIYLLRKNKTSRPPYQRPSPYPYQTQFPRERINY